MFRSISDSEKILIDKKFLSRCKSIELVINEKCQNACTYCYRKYKHDKSSVFSLDPSIVRTHLERFFDLIREDGKEFLKNRGIELFGGDPLLDYKQSKEILKIVDEYKPKNITIPTNARLVSELTEYDLEALFDGLDTRVGLSLSIDGDPSDNNRPLSKIGKMLMYDEKVKYKKLFKIAKDRGYGYHPMLSFKQIHKWLDTVQFFFNEFGVVPYLLEIRHSLSKENMIEAVIQLAKIRNFLEEIHKDTIKSANTIKASRVPRGLGCSALTTISIFPNGDMPFCHRVIDPPWVYGNVNYGIDITKAISLTSVYDHRNIPDCIICPIREICSGQCQGACYEYWGDPWIPIPSVCDYFRLKAYIFSLVYEDWETMVRQSFTNKNELKNSVLECFEKETINHILDEIK